MRNNDSNAFYSPEAGNYLHHEYWTLTSRVRKQLDDSWRYWMDLAEKGVFWMKMLLLMCLAFMMIPGAFGFRYYMWYLRSLQLVVHMPMLYIVCPSNVLRYLEIVKPIVVYDLLPSHEISDGIWNFDYETQREF